MSIKNGFVKRAMEFGYTEGQAIDIFNKVANDIPTISDQHTAFNAIPNYSLMPDMQNPSTRENFRTSLTNINKLTLPAQLGNQGVRDYMHNAAMSALPGNKAPMRPMSSNPQLLEDFKTTLPHQHQDQLARDTMHNAVMTNMPNGAGLSNLR